MNRGLLLNSSAVPRSIAGCGAAIGEVARSDGGVENNISSVCLYRFSLAVPRSITGYYVIHIEETPKKQ